MYYSNHYVIKWDRVQSLGDLKRVLAAAELAFEPNNRNIDSIRDLVVSEPKQQVAISL